MLKAVRDLGEFLAKKEGLDEIGILTESYKLENVKKVIFVVFKNVNGNIEFESVHIEEFDHSKAQRYLYRTFPHGQYDVTLTSKFSLADTHISLFLRKLEKRWNLWYKEVYSKYDYPIIKNLQNEMKKKKKQMMDEISEICEVLNKKEDKNILITISILEENQEKFLLDIDAFKKIFVEESIEYFYHKHDVHSKGVGVCSLCLKNTTVYGFASPFSVFTVDKKGFAYDFSRENAWKQFPICKDCAIYSNLGKKFLEEHLKSPLHGYYYYVIPRFVTGQISDDLIEEIESRKNEEYHRIVEEECYKPLLEDDLTDVIKNKRDTVNLIFVFLKPKQKDFFYIIKYVEDVPPSWIRKASDAFCQINSKIVFREKYLKIILGKEWSEDFLKGKWKGKRIREMNMVGMIRSFFSTDDYINIIGDILGARQIERDYLVRAFMVGIREKHIKDENWNGYLIALKSLYLLTFLIQMNLIDSSKQLKTLHKEVSLMETPKEEKGPEELENFFRDFSKAFDTPEKKAVFLEGVLTKLLLNIQFAERESTPFRSKLSGLKLNQRKVKGLLPEIMEKFTSYKVFKYQWMQELASKFFIEADENGWMISDNEISYYFALGLNLGQMFKGGG